MDKNSGLMINKGAESHGGRSPWVLLESLSQAKDAGVSSPCYSPKAQRKCHEETCFQTQDWRGEGRGEKGKLLFTNGSLTSEEENSSS